MTDSSSSSYVIEELIAAVDSGDLSQFLSDAYRDLDDEERAKLIEDAVNAHSQGKFDLDAALGRVERLTFTTQDFLDELIPKLSIDLTGLINIFARLDELTGGQEMGWLKPKLFEGWCQKAPDRPGIGIGAIRAGIISAELLRPALFASLRVDPDQYLPQVLQLLNSDNQPERDAAAWTLGHSSSLSGQNLVTAVDILERSPTSLDGSIHAGSLGALIAIAVKDPHFEQAAAAATARATVQGGPDIRLAAARELLGRIDNVGAPLVDAVLKLLCETEADEHEAIGAIDLIIAKRLSGAHAVGIAGLLDHLLARQGIPLQTLDGVRHAILTGDATARDQIVVRWLLDGRHELVRAVHDLVATNHGDPLKLDLDFTTGSLAADEAVAMARMITEALFIYPVTLASVLLSLLATGPVRAAPVIEDLLFDPLLTNYWVGPRKYLEEIQPQADAAIADAIARVLNAHDRYSAAVEAAGTIPELWPPDRHRFLVALKESEEGREISRAAESQSVLMSLIPKSVVLYGDAAIIGVHVQPGKIVRQESRMQSVEYSQEFPRLEVIDPLGQWYRREMLARGRDVS